MNEETYEAYNPEPPSRIEELFRSRQGRQAQLFQPETYEDVHAYHRAVSEYGDIEVGYVREYEVGLNATLVVIRQLDDTWQLELITIDPAHEMDDEVTRVAVSAMTPKWSWQPRWRVYEVDSETMSWGDEIARERRSVGGMRAALDYLMGHPL